MTTGVGKSGGGGDSGVDGTNGVDAVAIRVMVVML